MIYERKNSVLTRPQVRELEEKEPKQVDTIKTFMYSAVIPVSFFQVHHALNQMGYIYHEVSVKRALTDLCGSEHQDKYGNPFLIFNKETRRLNPNTGKTCGTYKVNSDYGFKKPSQVDMFGGVV